MKNKIIFSLSLTLLTAQLASAAKLKSDDISNMVIEGENRLRVHATPHHTAWTPEPYRDINDEFRGEQLANAFAPPAVAKPPLTFPSVLQSKKTATAWVADFFDSPILSINVKPGDKERKLTWVFLVKNSKGETIYESRHTGNIPDTFYWQGFDKNNAPLHVGDDYSYTLSILDEARNPKRFSGDAFRIPAFRFERGGNKVHLIDPDAVFESKSTNKLSKSGLRLLTELKDEMRSRYGHAVSVVSFEDDMKFSQNRADVIRRFLMNELDWEPTKITAQAGKKDAHEYRHLEIIVH